MIGESQKTSRTDSEDVVIARRVPVLIGPALQIRADVDGNPLKQSAHASRSHLAIAMARQEILLKKPQLAQYLFAGQSPTNLLRSRLTSHLSPLTSRLSRLLHSFIWQRHQRFPFASQDPRHDHVF